MRVSIINVNWVGHDATGRTITSQVHFFQRRGDEVQVYTLHPPVDLSEAQSALAQVMTSDELVDHCPVHFATSDLYIYHYPGFYSLLESIKMLERGAVIFYYHNVTPPELWGSEFERSVLEESVARVGEFIPYADFIVSDSEFNATQLVEEYAADLARVRVLPLAVALDQFFPGSKNPQLLRHHRLRGRRVILFVGRIAGNKRVDLLVEALALVQRQVPNAVLLLVGDDRGNPAIAENVARIKARAVELGIAKSVIFTGVVEDLPPYYRLADVYATASLHEGFGMPLIEAMASGRAVVASRATAHPWVVGEAGLLVEPGNAADLADKLVQVLTNDALCGELVRRGLERAQKFSLENYEIGWARIVDEVTAWLPNRPYPPLHSLAITASAPADSLTFEGELQELDETSDVMLRDYMVRSRLPFVGPLLAWLRRNLTSHLREPYLDPMFERQVKFNRQIVHQFRRMSAEWADRSASNAALESRIAELECRIDELTILLSAGTASDSPSESVE